MLSNKIKNFIYDVQERVRQHDDKLKVEIYVKRDRLMFIFTNVHGMTSELGLYISKMERHDNLNFLFEVIDAKIKKLL